MARLEAKDKVPVNKQHVISLIHSKGMTIRSLGDSPEMGVTSRTIRRNLDSGMMQLYMAERLIDILDVDMEDLK